MFRYVAGVEFQLKSFLEKFGDEGKSEINNICTAHTLTMDFDEHKKFSYCGCEVSPSGQLVILFSEGNLGTNIDYALESSNLTKALDSAPTADAAGPMSHSAHMGIKEYNAEIGKTQEKLNALLQKTLALEPNFEAVFEKLNKAADAPDGWQANMGSFVRLYFESLVDLLEREKFGEDEMLREGLLEPLEKEVVRFRVVDELKTSYNECVIEDGVLYLQVSSSILGVFHDTNIPQTKPQYFGTNVNDVAAKLMDIL